MVNRLAEVLRPWPSAEAALRRLAPRLTRRRTLTAPLRFAAPEPATIAPATFEMRFMRLHTEARFEEMWDMLAVDAQRAWGGLETFMREMPRVDDGTELLDIEVLDVKVLESWTDSRHDRSYSNVAQMMLRYRVRKEWRDWTLDRQVHLVPGSGGWRTLCYPA